jgi:hypothetical protein
LALWCVKSLDLLAVQSLFQPHLSTCQIWNHNESFNPISIFLHNNIHLKPMKKSYCRPVYPFWLMSV